MAKPVLGRGLASLLAPSRPATVPTPARPAGVQLLLRGSDGSELVQPQPLPDPDSAPTEMIPSWVLGSAVIGDAALLGIAAWLVLSGHGWGRMVAATLLVGLGCGIISVATWLRGHTAARELGTLNPLAEEKPRVRVYFMDEVPRSRGSR